MEQVKEGEEKEGNACRQTPRLKKKKPLGLLCLCAHIIIGCIKLANLWPSVAEVNFEPKQKYVWNRNKRMVRMEHSQWIQVTYAGFVILQFKRKI